MIISIEDKTPLPCGCTRLQVNVFKDGTEVMGVKRVNLSTRTAYIIVLEPKPNGTWMWDGWSQMRIEGVETRCKHGLLGT